MAVEKMSEAQVRERLAKLPEWSLRDGKLHRALRFPDFVAAFGFMSRVALVAERMDHHPDWFNAYNRVEVNLVTHAVSGISERDFALAERIDSLYDA